MIRTDTSITRRIDALLIDQNELEKEDHVSSGKLSASMLHQPLRFQILKTLGVERRPLDPYVLRKFARGIQVENYFVDKLKKIGVLVEAQKEVQYRDVVGIVDAVVNHYGLDFDLGVVPMEIKSVTNMAFNRFKKSGEINHHYCLQGALYGLAMESPQFSVTQIPSDDLRENITILDTRDYQGEIDKIIDNYNRAMQKRIIPEIEITPETKWTINPIYSMFDESWIKMSSFECSERLKQQGLWFN